MESRSGSAAEKNVVSKTNKLNKPIVSVSTWSGAGQGQGCLRMEDFHEFDNNLDYKVTPCLEKANPGTGSIAEFVEHRVLS